MKKLILLAVLFFGIVSCATNLKLRLSKKYDNIDPQLQAYVEDFKDLSNGQITDQHLYGLTMGFKKYKDDSSVVGTCHHSVNEIDINIDWWNSYQTSSERLELIFHELGHCILKRGHTSKPTHDSFLAWMERVGFTLGLFTDKGYLYDGCPSSFMHPYTLGDRCINKHFHYYINELFGRHEESNYVMLRGENRCKKPKIINKTDSWNKRDQNSFNRASRRCFELYNSCMKVFIKKKELTYNAICE